MAPPLSELKCLCVHDPETQVFRQFPELECICIHNQETQQGEKEDNAPIKIISKTDDQNMGAAAAYPSNYKGYGVNTGDECLHASCRRRKCHNQSLEMVLEAILLLLSINAAGAYTFGKMIQIRESDPNSKRCLEVFIALFGASFLCTFLGALTLLIIVSCREYYKYKKLCLMISNTAAFVLMMIGYCFVVAFNM